MEKMMESKIRVSGIQFAVSDDLSWNIERAKELSKIAFESGVKVLSFAELFNVPWFPYRENADPIPYAETIPGPLVEEFSSLARSWDMVMVLPICEVDGEDYYNSAAVIDATGELLGTYRKVHLPRLPLWYEKDPFTPGNISTSGATSGDGSGFPVFSTKYIKLGVQICWDNFFPEGSRILGLKGVELIVCPTASAMKTHERWERVISANAITNGLFALRVNRTGSEEAQDFYGESFLVNPEGELVGEPSGMNDSVSLFEIDLNEVERARKMWPFFDDRRPEMYKKIIEP